MELVHKLNGVVISEPIGFDNLQTTIKRHDYHGMSVEVSIGDLEFYGVAADMIKEAYNTDLDTEMTYVVTTENGLDIYSGKVDLSTYNEHIGQYFTVSCKVGEVGIKTTFNNRTDVDVDLNSVETMDGEKITSYISTPLKLPSKTIVYKNETRQEQTTSYSEEPTTGNQLVLPDDFRYAFLNLAFDSIIKNEQGKIEPLFHFAQIQEQNNVGGYADPIYSAEEVSEQEDVEVVIDVALDMTVTMSSSPFTNLLNDDPAIVFEPKMIVNGSTNKHLLQKTSAYFRKNDWQGEKSVKGSHRFTLNSKDISNVYLGISVWNSNVKGNNVYNNQSAFTVKINKGSYFSMTFKSNQKTYVVADTILVHNALNRIVEIVTDNKLSVKSSYYQSPISAVNKGELGAGALKTITNGYKIRGLRPDENNERNMPLSFKRMIENLEAIDCVGYGFSKEDGKDYIRVEKWDWFYQQHKLLDIVNPNEVTRKLDESLIITELSIGYKKYTIPEEVSSIDSIHGDRTFTTTTSALSKQKKVSCEFIADNYVIEEMRRAATTLESDEESKYDGDIFIFALKANYVYEYGMSIEIPYDIDTDYNSAFIIPGDIYNATISPTRNAFRWLSRLLCVQGIKPFKLTSGTANYKACYSTKKGEGEERYIEDSLAVIPSLDVHDDTGTVIRTEHQSREDITLQEIYYANVKENADGGYTPLPSQNDITIPRVFKAEELSVKYPISVDQYQTIKDNPYGIVSVNGEECWIKEFRYDFNTSEAEFKLTPKAK